MPTCASSRTSVGNVGTLSPNGEPAVQRPVHSLCHGSGACPSRSIPPQSGPPWGGLDRERPPPLSWHGYDYCPLTGDSPFGDSVPTYPIEVREDGLDVGLGPRRRIVRTVTDVMAETLVNWGVRHVFGMVGHSNLGLADAIRRQDQAGRLTYIEIRHEGAAAFAASAYGKLTGRRRRA